MVPLITHHLPYPHPILVVDDSELALEMAGDVLRDCGYSPHCISDPRLALPALREQPIEIVLLDMMMPELSGIEVLWQIRKEEPLLGRQIMVFVVTAMSDRKMALEALRAGAYFYMTKPLRQEAFLPSLQRCIAQLEQSRDPETIETSRALRDRIAEARAASALQDVGLRQPETPNVYPHPIMIVGPGNRGSVDVGADLLSHGYHVLDCPSVERALLLFASHPVDIVLVDLDRGLDDASRFIEQVRRASLAVRRRVSILATVDQDRDPWRRNLMSAGATFVLGRPLQQKPLLEAVDWAARRALEA